MPAHRHLSSPPPRGFALGVVLVLLLALAAAIGATLAIYKASSKSGAAFVRKREAFYVCDGVSRLIAATARNYVSQTDTPTVGELNDAVCAAAGTTSPCASSLPRFTPTGYQVEDFQLFNGASGDAGIVATDAIIPSGPYKGLSARTLPLNLKLAMENTQGSIRCSIDVEMSVATVGLFSFVVFSDPPASFAPDELLRVDGHVHANDKLCLGGTGELYLEDLTAAGEVHSHDDTTNCWVSRGDEAFVYDGSAAFPALTDVPPYAPFKQVTPTDDHDHASWAASAPTSAWWDGHLLDEAHHVRTLRPDEAIDAVTQPSQDATGAVSVNDGSFRYLLDPVRSGDADNVRSSKLACQADIRIINGAWYLRAVPTPASPCGGWPGTPIWSDHPGSWSVDGINQPEEFDLVTGQALGQHDLDTNQVWGGTVPARYSYYRFDLGAGDEGELLGPSGTKVPAVSYGALSGGKPAHWASTGGAEEVCDTDASPLFADAGTLTPYDSNNCDIGNNAALLDASRTGFIDPMIAMNSTGTPEARARMLPINLDIDALHDALKDTATGELGDHFSGPREFNGIVWIGATWLDSQDGYGSTTDYAGGTNVWPPQGVTQQTSQPSLAHPQAQVGAVDQPQLPYMLCGHDGLAADEVAGNAMVPSGTNNEPFVVPDCDDDTTNGYGDGLGAKEMGPRYNAVRVFNGAVISNSADIDNVLDKGLTIATPLPLYVMGDLNSGSVPDVPVLVAGDRVRFLSNGWSDANVAPSDPTAVDHSGNSVSSGDVARVATATTYRCAVFAGQVQSAGTAYGGGIENTFGLLEDWNGVDLTFTGSLVVGFEPVYTRWPDRGEARREPNYKWSFDPNLSSVLNQPPGTPRFHFLAVRSWAR